MIAELDPRHYDVLGADLDLDLEGPHGEAPMPSTEPMGRYLAHPLRVQVGDLHELQSFLAGCRYVSDAAQFGEIDVWVSPEHFEELRQGDCEDFALWTWRQLIGLGLNARFVIGAVKGMRDGHAWVAFEEQQRWYLLETTASRFGPRLPRLTARRYTPWTSVALEGEALRYFGHAPRSARASVGDWIELGPEWLGYWSRVWLAAAQRRAGRAFRAWAGTPRASGLAAAGIQSRNPSARSAASASKSSNRRMSSL